MDAIRRIDKAQAKIDAKTKGRKGKPYEPLPGEYWVTELVLQRGEEWPTLAEWVEDEQKKRGNPSG